MKKIVLFLMFFSAVLSAQVKTGSVYTFNNANSFSNLVSFKEYCYAVDYQKYLDFSVPFSIYNPKPGFNPTKIDSQKYYSFANTGLLLKREMSNIRPEPIFPDQEKKKTFGEAVFYGVLDGVFNKN